MLFLLFFFCMKSRAGFQTHMDFYILFKTVFNASIVYKVAITHETYCSVKALVSP